MLEKHTLIYSGINILEEDCAQYRIIVVCHNILMCRTCARACTKCFRVKIQFRHSQVCDVNLHIYTIAINCSFAAATKLLRMPKPYVMLPRIFIYSCNSINTSTWRLLAEHQELACRAEFSLRLDSYSV